MNEIGCCSLLKQMKTVWSMLKETTAYHTGEGPVERETHLSAHGREDSQTPTGEHNGSLDLHLERTLKNLYWCTSGADV